MHRHAAARTLLFLNLGGILSLAAWGDAPKGVTGTLPPGTAKVWEDRGPLTPKQAFWGEASLQEQPASRLPVPPFSKFELDDNHKTSTNPKCRLVDKNGVKWTVKFGEEVHADIAAARLAWALGFGADENYYVKSGTIDGITPTTDLGLCKPFIAPDGTFGDARFKRHNKDEKHPEDAKGEDVLWDERVNPGLPPEQLSGLLILEVMTHNWDAQPKNDKVIHKDGKNGPENWFIVSDWGASFGQKPSKGNLKDYQKEESFIKSVSGGSVQFHFDGAIKSVAAAHEKIPLAHAQWFRKQLERLTDDDIRAAFQAAYATDAVMQNPGVRDDTGFNPLVASEINGFVDKFRAKIEEFKAKVPTQP